jgi:HAD superfamily hydrolase (TIGR01484 family)
VKPNPLLSAHNDQRHFLFFDLDGTLAPYGEFAGSPEAYPVFHRLLARPEIITAYVTGRDLQGAKRVIAEHGLPLPNYLAAADGAIIEKVSEGQFILQQGWWDVLGRDWSAVSCDAIVDSLSRVSGLVPQEPQFQSRYRACFYTDYQAEGSVMVNRVQSAMLGLRLRCQVLHSRDDHRQVGYLDVMPLGSGKLGAVRWLISQTGVSLDQAIFAGDAGNDLPALSSGIRAVMPRNGQEQVHKEAHAALEKKERGLSKRIYKAKGGFLGFDGDVLGGVLEGLSMHFPHMREWMV